jgi:hypothetical protein
MATYLTWHRNPAVRRVTWVCGTEACLAREVVAAHRAGAGPDQAVTWFAGEVPERAIWDQLLSYPPPGGRRAVVYEADRLRDLHLVADLVAARGMDAAVTVFVSAEPDFGDGPHLRALRASRDGQMVRCCAPSSLEDRVALVASWWPGAAPNLGYEVLARCGSLEDAWKACEQARLAGLEPTAAMAGLVCPQAAGGDLADVLMAGDKPKAMALAAAVPRAEIPGVIGLLEYRLSLAQQMGAGLRSGLPPREAAARLHVDRFVAGKVAPYAAAYDAPRVRRLRGVLADADAACRSGAAVGVAESLVALW